MSIRKVDLNGDGISDLILQDETTGDVTTLLMQNGAPVSTITYHVAETYPSTYKITGFGDFDGSGTTDVLFHSLSNDIAIDWLTGANGVVVGNPSYNWMRAGYDVVGTGDYSADGNSDLLWRGETDGQLMMWQMNSSYIKAYTSLGQIPTSYSIVDGASDFTGDGKSDILFRGMDDGQTTLWAMNGSEIAQRIDFGKIPTSVSLLDTKADLNADGTHDLLWYDHDSGNVVEWLMHDGHPTVSIIGNVSPSAHATLISADGDYNGDGISDLLWNVGGNLVTWTMNIQGGIFSVDYVHDSNGNQVLLGATQIVEDAVDTFDGSGRSSLVIRDTSTGAVQVLSMLGPTATNVTTINAGPNSTVANGAGSGVVINADQSHAYYGTDGSDTFVIQSGGATVTGGAGDNLFHVSGFNWGATITDFKPNADQLVLDHTAFINAVGAPVYDPGVVSFTSGTAGPEVGDARYQFYYQATTGQLWYAEPFGSVANQYELIATLQNHPTLSSHDILLA